MPSLNRGTFILLAPNATDANISSSNVFFVFQYNPETLIHIVNQGTPPSDSPLGVANEQPGVPPELFNLTFELDSLDVDPPAQNQNSGFGLHPALAMLELMMEPQVVGTKTYMPIVVFKWGANRSVAVRIVTMNVEEKAFDEILNPVRATVSLSLQVLAQRDVNGNLGARGVYASHQNMRSSLVSAYMLQTGQGSIAGASGVSGSSSSVGAGSSLKGATK